MKDKGKEKKRTAKREKKKADKKEEEPKEEKSVEIVEEGGYTPKQKPQLSDDMKRSLSLRRSIKARKPKFRRQEWFRYKRIGEEWRRPKGLHSKMRVGLKYRPPVVSVGYGSPAKARHLHPSGFQEVMVYRIEDLEGIDPKTQAARIGHTVGSRKRSEILEKADEMGIRVLNRGGGAA